MSQPPGTGRRRFSRFKGSHRHWSPSGKLSFHLFGALAEFEPNTRTHVSGLGHRSWARPKALDANKRQVAVELYHAKKLSVKKICDVMGISKPTMRTFEAVNKSSK